ncbi:MAG TPA: GGDEF domain-containing protein [Solirubrobacteraceae bacterium]|nr:GGDEF domain-containing protein [Solirubrobacteraceae bacterium]
MSHPGHNLRLDKKVMAYTAAAMYGAAALDAALESLLPGDPSFAIAPALVALSLVALILLLGPLISRWALAPLGPLGVGLIAYALATTPGAGDGAVLYMWPVLWTTFFFGRRGAVAIVACIGVADVLALLALPAASAYPGRWVDVMVSVCVVATVALMLVNRNDQLLARMAGDARTDELTGLLNRRGFDERALVELARARRNDQSIALVMLDLDHFKHINDEWGHDIGDRVLASTGKVLAEVSRDIDVVARFGGEEFLVMLPDSDSLDAEAFAGRVRTALAESDASGLPAVRVSAGVHASSTIRDVETLLRRADTALYDAKRAGRDRTVVFQG